MPQPLIHKAETFGDFEKSKQLNQDNASIKKPQFTFFTSAVCKSTDKVLYRRRDYFKVSFLRGEYLVHYGDESIRVNGTSLSIFNPKVPYTVETIHETYNAGYFIFTDLFYDDFFKQPIRQFPLFANGNKSIYLLDTTQEAVVKSLFQKIESHALDNYEHRYDLIRNHINELLHFACSLNPVSEKVHTFTSQERLLHVFLELLERQFPVDSSPQPDMIRKASDFADELKVHVNYLNRVVKNNTGKSTTQHIGERYLKESILLLKHTNYSISEIAYSLGFSDASHFNHFFKSMTTTKPSDYRKISTNEEGEMRGVRGDQRE